MPERPDLTPGQEREVRRQLADARHTDPMPPEVADRLERVLGGLSAEPVREATVVRLARRRRRAATLLVAAAAVVVGGVVVARTVGGPDTAGESSTAAQAPDAAESDAGHEPEPQGAGDDELGALSRDDGLATTNVRIRPGRFAADVARVQARVPEPAQDYATQPQEAGAGRRGKASVCEPGNWGRGIYVPVRYGPSTGYVVLRRPQGDTQVADLFLCGGELAVRSVTLTSR